MIVHVQWCAVHIDLQPTRRAVVADLVVRIGGSDAAREVLAGIRSHVPGYERLPDDQLDGEVLESCRSNLRQWAGWLLTGATPPDAELEHMRAEVRARATAGVPLEDLLDAYRLGGRMGWQILRRNARPHEREALLDAAELLMAYIDRACAIVTEAYLEAGGAIAAEEERDVRALLAALLRPGPLDASDSDVAQQLGVPVRETYVPFAAVVPGATAERHAQLAARLRRSRRALAATEGDRVFGLAWDGLVARDVEDGAVLLLACDDPTARAELAGAREDVLLLVDHARRAGITGTLTVADHLPELLLAHAPQLAARLHEQVVGALTPELRTTLQTLVACRFDRRETSTRLHVHRNTLAYRVARIEEHTGLDLGSPRDVARTYLALQAG